jgi:hypothetical protein
MHSKLQFHLANLSSSITSLTFDLLKEMLFIDIKDRKLTASTILNHFAFSYDQPILQTIIQSNNLDSLT